MQVLQRIQMYLNHMAAKSYIYLVANYRRTWIENKTSITLI